MIRKIIQIEEEKCNGCGICASACHEGAIEIINGKATLTREDYCDGFGDCLPACPTGAITFVEREAPAYDEKAVLENKLKKIQSQVQSRKPSPAGCPGSKIATFNREEAPKPAQGGCPGSKTASFDRPGSEAAPETALPVQTSQLRQWPCQIKLVPVNAPYFDGAKLLIAADCTAYAYAAFHQSFMRGRITLIGCPKLDAIDYSQKLTAILSSNDIREVLVLRMEVPCCGGLENAAITALKSSGKFLPWRVVTISIDGQILE